MKNKNQCFVLILGFAGLTLLGCQTTQSGKAAAVRSGESPEEIAAALESVVAAVSGQDVDAEDLRELSKQIQNDEEAQTSVQAITDSMAAPGSRIKYCPEDGKRYSAKLEYCPGTKIRLKYLDE